MTTWSVQTQTGLRALKWQSLYTRASPVSREVMLYGKRKARSLPLLRLIGHILKGLASH